MNTVVHGKHETPSTSSCSSFSGGWCSLSIWVKTKPPNSTVLRLSCCCLTHVHTPPTGHPGKAWHGRPAEGQSGRGGPWAPEPGSTGGRRAPGIAVVSRATGKPVPSRCQAAHTAPNAAPGLGTPALLSRMQNGRWFFKRNLNHGSLLRLLLAGAGGWSRSPAGRCDPCDLADNARAGMHVLWALLEHVCALNGDPPGEDGEMKISEARAGRSTRATHRPLCFSERPPDSAPPGRTLPGGSKPRENKARAAVSIPVSTPHPAQSQAGPPGATRRAGRASS